MGLIGIISKSIIFRSMLYDDKEGLLYLWGMPYFMIPNDSFAYLQKKLTDKFGNIVPDLLFYLGKKHGYNATNIVMNKYGVKFFGNYKFFVEQSDLVGIGSVILDSTDKENKVHKAHNLDSPISNSHLKLFGKSKEPVDHYLMGLSAGVSDSLDGWDNLSVEESCRAMGDEQCNYITADKSYFKKNSKNFKRLPNEIKSLEKIYNSFSLNKILDSSYQKRESINSKNFSFSEGKLYIGGIAGLFTAMYVLIIFDKILFDNYGEKYLKEIKDIGKFQGLTHVKNLKLNKKVLSPQIINNLLITLNPYGFGKFKISRSLNKGKIIFVSSSRNQFAEQYSKLFGKQKRTIDPYIEGLLGGFFEELTGKKTQVKEVLCYAKGNKECSFEIRFNS